MDTTGQTCDALRWVRLRPTLRGRKLDAVNLRGETQLLQFGGAPHGDNSLSHGSEAVGKTQHSGESERDNIAKQGRAIFVGAPGLS